MIRFMKESQKQAWFIENDIIWYPVKEILNTGKIEDVYNIEVKEDHTYTANNMTYSCNSSSNSLNVVSLNCLPTIFLTFSYIPKLGLFARITLKYSTRSDDLVFSILLLTQLLYF